MALFRKSCVASFGHVQRCHNQMSSWTKANMDIQSKKASDTENGVTIPSGRILQGPKGYPIIGNLLTFSTHSLHIQAQEWQQAFGPIFECTVLYKKFVFVSDLNLMKQTCLEEKNSGRLETFIGQYVLPYSIAMSKDVNLSMKLKTLMLTLLQKRSELEGGNSYILKHMQNHFKKVVDLPTVSVSDVLKGVLEDYITNQLIGETIPDSDPDKNLLWEFIDLLYTMIDPSVDSLLRIFPYLRRLPGYYGNIYRETIEARDRVAKRYFDDQKKSYQAGNIRGLVDICIMTQEEQKERDGEVWLTDEYIKGLVFDTLAAGMTEMMKFLRLFILLMCHHQGVQTRLQAEIDRTIGTERSPTAHHRHCMPYTEAVRLEVLRFGSQTPLAIPHLCNKDVVVDGYLIPEGSVIFPNLYGVHHDETIWGDPWVFRPERFLDRIGALLPCNHRLMENVIPFGVGKRACPGQQFAEDRTFIGMTSLLQRMRFLPPENSELPSADPRLYTRKYPLVEPAFDCKVATRDNIVL